MCWICLNCTSVSSCRSNPISISRSDGEWPFSRKWEEAKSLPMPAIQTTMTFTVIHSVSSAPYHPQNNSSFSSQTSRGGAVTDPSALPSLAVTATMAARACMSLRLHKQQTSSLRPSLSPARASDDTRLRLSNTAHVRNGTEAQSCQSSHTAQHYMLLTLVITLSSSSSSAPPGTTSIQPSNCHWDQRKC